MWILTQSYNEHDQFGDYFISAFENRPTEDEIKKVLKNECELDPHLSSHVLQGGGRRNQEYSYFSLFEVASGERVG